MSENGTYLDAVLDEKQFPIFNGTPEETLEWLKINPYTHDLSVCIGQTLRVIPVKEYMAKAEGSS